MQAWHQKNRFEPDFPFHLMEAESLEFSPHWHEEVEIIYLMEGNLQAGLNHEVYSLHPGDILLISSGDVHYFLSQSHWNRSVVIQLGLSFLNELSIEMGDRKFIRPLIGKKRQGIQTVDEGVYRVMEQQILAMIREHQLKDKGYQMALKARLYDLVVTLLRQVPMEQYSSRERSKQMGRLERLKKVFQYVEYHYDENITLEEIAGVANFSVYHFTRFFKEATGMTFVQYLSSLRVKKAERYLLDTEDSVTEVAFRAGFNSIKTFNRVFKQVKGCSPTRYRQSNI